MDNSATRGAGKLAQLGLCVAWTVSLGCGSGNPNQPGGPEAGLASGASEAGPAMDVDAGTSIDASWTPADAPSTSSADRDGSTRADSKEDRGRLDAGDNDAAPVDSPVQVAEDCVPGSSACGLGGGLRRCALANGRYSFGDETPCPGHKVCGGSAPGASCVCPKVPPGCEHESFDCSGSKLTRCGRDSEGCAYVTSETPCVPRENGYAQCFLAMCSEGCNNGYHLCNDKCVPDDSATGCGSSCAVCPGPVADPNGVPACSFGQPQRLPPVRHLRRIALRPERQP
jgi:hypothetical protein